MSGSIFGGGSLSAWGSLIVFGFVPVLIGFGAGIPAWALGSNLWSGFLSGMIAMGVIVLIHVVGNPNYSPFNDRETLEFVGAISVTVLISMAKRDLLQLGKLVVVFTLTMALLGLKFVIPENEIELVNVSFKVGFVISLLAWLILPLAAAFITIPKQNR